MEAELKSMPVLDLIKEIDLEDQQLKEKIAQADEAKIKVQVEERKKGKKILATSKPSQNLKEVRAGIEHDSQLKKLDRRLLCEKMMTRRFPEKITGCHLKRKRGQSVPCIRVVREGYETSSESVDLDRLGDMGYTEWVELHDIIFKQSSIHRRVVLDEIEKKFEKIKSLKIDLTGQPLPSYFVFDEEDDSVERPLKRTKKAPAAPEGRHEDFLKNLTP